MAEPSRSLDDWLRWQETLHPSAIELGLDRVGAVAARLALPWRQPRSIIVAGTNGKGSSAHLLAAIYRAAGYRVGLYTSPHLHHYRERVQIDGVCPDDAAWCEAFAAIEAQRQSTPLTYFEFGTLAALWLMRQAQVQVQVLEVGLGGRLDAVNLVDADAALLTQIGLDHMDWLGPDRESIGREKAGVMRAGALAVVADPQPPASVLAHAKAIGADLRLRGRDFEGHAQGDRFKWHGKNMLWPDLPLPAPGDRAQLDNASGVLAVVEGLCAVLPTPQDAVTAALAGLKLPGRFEQIGNVILDVGHNPDAARVLAARLAATPVAGPTVLLLGMLADKSPAQVWAALRAQVDRLVLLDLPPPRGLAAQVLGERIGVMDDGLPVQCVADPATALDVACKQAGTTGRIVVTGSFLTVAAARQALNRQ